MNITVSAYNRPEYLEQTLSGLRSCIGIESCRVVVLIDQSDEATRSAAISARYGCASATFDRRAGCNQAIRAAFEFGFEHMGSEFHLHFEDDTVPCRDALRWFAWARDHYRDDPGVMNVSGYQKISNGRPGECGLRRWFTPWGWGMWRDRWLGLSLGWARDDSVSWDVVVNHALRAGRYEAFPTVSRIQNIGANNGTHVPDAEWHSENQHVEETADSIAGDPVLSWVEVRRDEHADHA